MNSLKGDYVLDQEKHALDQIRDANKEKDDLLRKAKDAAKKELNSYDEQKQSETQDRITELTSNTTVIDEIYDKKEADIKEINENFAKNKQKVIDFLFDNVLKIEYNVPDVVKGCFEEKFGIKEE